MINAMLGKSRKDRNSLIRKGYSDLAIIKTGWKFIPGKQSQSDELYNLSEDLSEKNNLISKSRKKLEHYRSCYNMKKTD